MADFATPTDLRHFLGIAHENVDMGRAKRLLAQATQLIKDYCRQTIERVANDAVTLIGRGEETLLLPELPVVSIASITEDAVAVPAADFDAASSGVLRRLVGAWGTESDPSTIVVTYTHGFSPLPQSVRAICLSITGRAYSFRQPGIESLALDGLSEARGYWPDMVLTMQEQKALEPYALPYALTR